MIKLLNKAQVEKKLNSQIKIMAKTNEEALIEVGERAVGILARNTPVKDGRLRNSMSYTIGGKVVDPLQANDQGDKLNKVRENDKIVIGTNVIYAPSVEYLAKNGSAGFMLRSYKQLVPIAKKVMQSVMKGVFK